MATKTYQVTMWDRMEFDAASNVRFLDDGRMTAMPRVARTGIQLYLGREIGLKDDDANKVVRVYRPDAEVFDAASMTSFTHKAVTNDHPPESVDASNFRKYAVGWTGDEVARDGECFRVPMMVADAQAVADYKAGKRELSNGYSCEIVMGDGVSPKGEAYDAQMFKIRGNHVAIVDAARGGKDLRIGDHDEEQTMSDKALTTLLIDGAPLQVDAIVAGVIQAHISRLTATSDGFKAEAFKTKEELAAEKEKAAKKDAETVVATAAKDAEIVVLKQAVKDAAVTPQMLDKMLTERNEVIGKAKAVMGDKASTLKVDGSVADIKKQVVDGHLGERTKDWTPAHYDAAFASMTASVKAADEQRVEDAWAGHRPGYAGGSNVVDAAAAFAPSLTVDATTKAYDDYDKEQADAWKRPAAKA